MQVAKNIRGFLSNPAFYNAIDTGTTHLLNKAAQLLPNGYGQNNNSNLSENSIDLDLAKKIAEALKTNTTITSINLSYTNICTEGVRALAEALKANTTITSLNLSNNNITQEGATALAEALKTNTTIAHITLSNNNIGSNGATAIANALKDNISLIALDLSLNNIDDEGAETLAKTLEDNKNITLIDLDDNHIGNEGANAINTALKNNNAVTTFNLDGNDLDDELYEEITAITENNNNIFESLKTSLSNYVSDLTTDNLSQEKITHDLLPSNDTSLSFYDNTSILRKIASNLSRTFTKSFLKYHIEGENNFGIKNYIIDVLNNSHENVHIYFVLQGICKEEKNIPTIFKNHSIWAGHILPYLKPTYQKSLKLHQEYDLLDKNHHDHNIDLIGDLAEV